VQVGYRLVKINAIDVTAMDYTAVSELASTILLVGKTCFGHYGFGY
jgi:hypothetical protein